MPKTRDIESHTTNRILLALPPASRRNLAPLLSKLHLERGHVLFEMGQSISHVYFVESGLVALAKPMRDGRVAEIGAIGREGIVTPTAVFRADRAAMNSIVEIPATVLRIDQRDFRRRLASDRAFLTMVERYSGAVMSQLTQTAACNILHAIQERYSRWLLFAHDSALSERFPITHEFVATLMGVRRASVQVAAAALQRSGFISYVRGMVTVLDRAGLERSACECYETIQTDFAAAFSRRRVRP